MLSIPKRQGWEMELTGGKQESETAVARFLSMPIKPGKKTTLEVKEKYPSFASYSIGDARAQQALLVYIQSSQAKPELVAKLQPIVDKVRKLSDTQAKIQTTEQKRSDLQQRAEEIRENLRLLKRSRNQKLKDEQTARLVEVDRQLNQATDQLVASREQAAELSVELSTLIEKLEITF
jgi:uncharacterized phage infection (PIP) family protein YhgE